MSATSDSRHVALFVYFTDRGIEGWANRRGDEEILFEWLAERSRLEMQRKLEAWPRYQVAVTEREVVRREQAWVVPATRTPNGHLLLPRETAPSGPEP
ncbi:DUF6104 family protein [Streptomyces sp. NPDC051822]|uniref:DUF6104 family protein n=1 Tax=Streptomyces sp. NPDC051822 TaxID=3365675 RepID=UPI003793DF9B